MGTVERDERALSFGSVADHYERGRPSYPEDAIRWLVPNAPANVVDLGAGTGKLTRQLVKLGHRVVAVEPSMPMLRRCKVSEPKAWAVGASAEAIPIETGWADAVTAGQAFHWFDLDSALPEIKRILAVGSRLALLWNLREEATEWVRELSKIVSSRDAHVSGVADSERFGDDPARGAIINSGLFGPIEHQVFSHEHVVDRDGLVDLVMSRSNVVTLPSAERAEVLRRVDRLCATHPDLAGREPFTLPYRTHAFRTERH